MARRLAIMLAALTASGFAALADPIEGNWKTPSGATAGINACGGDFCITMRSGRHVGKKIGQMSAEGSGAYSGTITDPANDKTYSGSAKLAGSTMKMSGCVLGGVICRTQTWSKL